MLAVVPAFAASPTYPTSAVAQSGSRLTTIDGNRGILVNCTSSLASPFDGIIYMDLTNAQGQTVYWNLGSCNFSQGTLVQCFVSISSSVAPGSYTAFIFATTSTGVALSTTSSFKVTL